MTRLAAALLLLLIPLAVSTANADARDTSRFARPPAQPVPAQPVPRCFARAQIAERLADAYSEQQRAGGLQSAGALIEVWASETGSTWTILLTRPDGISCVLATGTNWAGIPPAPAGKLN